MITLWTIKKVCKKTWVWIKHNWYVPAVLVYTLFLWFILRKKNEAEAVLAIRDSSYKAQIETLNKAHEEEIKKRDEILKKYSVIIKELENYLVARSPYPGGVGPMTIACLLKNTIECFKKLNS